MNTEKPPINGKYIQILLTLFNLVIHLGKKETGQHLFTRSLIVIRLEIEHWFGLKIQTFSFIYCLTNACYLHFVCLVNNVNVTHKTILLSKVSHLPLFMILYILSTFCYLVGNNSFVTYFSSEKIFKKRKEKYFLCFHFM